MKHIDDGRKKAEVISLADFALKKLNKPVFELPEVWEIERVERKDTHCQRIVDFIHKEFLKLKQKVG